MYRKAITNVKVNDHKSHLIFEVTDPENLGPATSNAKMKKIDKANVYEDIVYSLEMI